MTLLFFRNADNVYVGAYDGVIPPEGSIEVPYPPDNTEMRWDVEQERWYWPRDAAIKAVKERLNWDFTNCMQVLQSDFPLYELLTWDRQSYEANLWMKAPDDAKPETPFLSNLYSKTKAMGVDEPFSDLLERVVANENSYIDAVTSIMAIRHVAERQIEAAEDPFSVTWQFPL